MAPQQLYTVAQVVAALGLHRSRVHAIAAAKGWGRPLDPTGYNSPTVFSAEEFSAFKRLKRVAGRPKSKQRKA